MTSLPFAAASLATRGQGGKPGVLLICARLFSYHELISECLQELGFEVTWWDPRPSTTTAYRAALRIAPALMSDLSTKAFESRLRELEPQSIQHVLVIKGEGLSSRAVASLRDALPNASATLYLWDGIENARGAAKIAGQFDRVLTFDPCDAKERGWIYRPLFAKSRATPSVPRGEPLYDCTFIGTIHSDRHRVLQRLRAEHPTWRFFAYCYFQSRFMFAARMCMDPGLWRAPAGTLHTRPMSTVDVESVLDRSRLVLDVEHPGQRGLTMRTIETLLAGRKLVTTNRHILSSDLFHPTRVCLVDRARPLVPQEFIEQDFEPIEESVRLRYTIALWTRELMGL